MISPREAQDALNKLYGDAEEWYMLEEFIKQYRDWVKVKEFSYGALLTNREKE